MLTFADPCIWVRTEKVLCRCTQMSKGKRSSMPGPKSSCRRHERRHTKEHHEIGPSAQQRRKAALLTSGGSRPYAPYYFPDLTLLRSLYPLADQRLITAESARRHRSARRICGMPRISLLSGAGNNAKEACGLLGGSLMVRKHMCHVLEWMEGRTVLYRIRIGQVTGNELRVGMDAPSAVMLQKPDECE